MSKNHFNHQIETYYKEHPDCSRNMDVRIRAAFDVQDSESRMHFHHLAPSAHHLAVFLHPHKTCPAAKQRSHDYFELLYVSKGNCTQMIGQESCNLSLGDFCLLNPYITHKVDLDSADTLLFHLMIHPSLFRGAFLEMLNGSDRISHFFMSSLYDTSRHKYYLYFPHVQNIPRPDRADELMQALILELYGQQTDYEKAAENYLSLFFTELLRRWQQQTGQIDSSIASNPSLTEILTYISQNKQEVSLLSVAEKFHYHPKYLSALIKKYTNQSFSQIVQNARLQEVCNYLECTDLSIEEIGHRMGYHDRRYFNRLFKKKYQMSPSEYRQMHQKHTDGT